MSEDSKKGYQKKIPFFKLKKFNSFLVRHYLKPNLPQMVVITGIKAEIYILKKNRPVFTRNRGDLTLVHLVYWIKKTKKL